MADIQFRYLGNCRKMPSRVEVEAVAGMDFESGLCSESGAVPKALKLARGCSFIAGKPGITIFAGMQLDYGRHDLRRSLDLPRLGIDEQGNANTFVAKLLDDRSKQLPV